MDARTGDGSDRVDFTPGIRLLARLARVAEQACQGAGITLPQYRLLVSVSRKPRRAGELAARVGVSPPTLTSLVNGLEQSKLLRRVPVATDRRGIRLEPTEAGREAVMRAEGALTDRLLKLVDRDTALTATGVITALGAALDRDAGGRRLPC